MEEQEIATELIGEGEHRHLMFWEAAEDGTGVWERLIEEPGAIAEMAKRALSICHYDPDNERGEKNEKESCIAVCYECLLSYTNQPRHRLIDWRLIRDFLYQLDGITTQVIKNKRTPEEQYEWLKTERTLIHRQN